MFWWSYSPEFENQRHSGPDGQETCWKPHWHKEAAPELKGSDIQADKQTLCKCEEELGISVMGCYTHRHIRARGNLRTL